MANTPKAIRYYDAAHANNYTTYYTGTDADVDAQWTQLTQNNGLLLDGVTTAVHAERFNPATLDSNNRCTGGTKTDTWDAPIVPTIVITGATGSKAIPVPTVAREFVRITKTSAATDLTIIPAVSGTDDGKEIVVTDEDGHAHVITQATTGFNGKGSSGTVTFGGTKGSRVVLYFDKGQIWAQGTGVTIA